MNSLNWFELWDEADHGIFAHEPLEGEEKKSESKKWDEGKVRILGIFYYKFILAALFTEQQLSHLICQVYQLSC